MKQREISKKKVKVPTEKETLEHILSLAREQGVEEKVQNLYMKYSDILKSAKSPEERQQIATLGLVEIHKTIGCVGSLIINGVEVLPPDNSYEDIINQTKGVVRLD
jgi:hypothetical protein